MKILKNVKLEDTIFLDIETVNIVQKLEKGTPLWDSWEYKQKYSKDKTNPENDAALVKLYHDSGALYPEFAKVCCISIGKIKDNVLRVKSYYGEDENKILNDFTNAMNGILASNKNTVLSGFALKGFDLPFLIRRSLINGIEPASLIDFGALKPWEINILDIYEIWKGTSFNSASLLTVTTALGLPSPKEDIFGYEVNETYYSSDEKRLDRIARYCERDILAACNVLLKIMLLPAIGFGEIPIVEESTTPLLTKLFNGGKYGLKEAKILTEEYSKANENQKEAMMWILKSLIDKTTSFTEDNLQAIINYKPKTDASKELTTTTKG